MKIPLPIHDDDKDSEDLFESECMKTARQTTENGKKIAVYILNKKI